MLVLFAASAALSIVGLRPAVATSIVSAIATAASRPHGAELGPRDAPDLSYGSINTAPASAGTFSFSNQNCSQYSQPNLVFADSPEDWNSFSWVPDHGLVPVNAGILAAEPINANSLDLVAFDGINDFNTYATLYVDIAGGGTVKEDIPAWSLGSKDDPVSVGKAVSAQFLTNYFQNFQPVTGARLYSVSVPPNGIINGELGVTVTSAATIYIWASRNANCQLLSCAHQLLQDQHHARGVFNGGNIIVYPSFPDLSTRDIDLGQTSGTDCTGPTPGIDYTLQSMTAESNVGDYGDVYYIGTGGEAFMQRSTDWFIGPTYNQLPLALGNWPPYVYDNGGQETICPQGYALPLTQEALKDNTKAIYLGSINDDQAFLYQLADGATSPNRLFGSPSTALNNSIGHCVTP